MPELSRSQTVSRSAFLDLQQELQLVNDGYEFLDEKRILLAAEMLRQRKAYRAARRHFAGLCESAAAALLEAAADQGLDGLQVYPSATLSETLLHTEQRAYVGLILLDAKLDIGAVQAPYSPLRPSPELRVCCEWFRKLLPAAAKLAALSANVKRLVHEYRRTERRVRALEHVVLPEIRLDLATMEEHLDLVEQEEVIRVRTALMHVAR